MPVGHTPSLHLKPCFATAQTSSSRRTLPLGLILILLVFISSCGANRPAWVDSFLDLFPKRTSGLTNYEGFDEKSIEEMKADLVRFEAIINEKLAAAESAVNLYRLLAEQYNDLGMYDLALEHYEGVLRIEPANYSVLNSAGIAAGQTALSRPTVAEKLAYLERAQRYYERAIELNPAFRDPYFGLAVLYLFEFDDIEAAKTILDKALALFADDSRLLFLLAQVAVREDRINDAVEIYDSIAENSKIPAEKNAAISNREELLGSY